MTDMEVLRGPFDPELHKKAFVHYFEAILTADGTVVYAVPSHVRVLERLYTARYGQEHTYDEYRRWLTSHKTICDYLEWLMETTGAICLWTRGFLGMPNATQQRRIDELVDQGILEVRR